MAASRDVATYSSARGVSFEEPTDEDMAARRTIIDTDPPEHTKLRKIVSGHFSQRAVAVYEHFIAGLTEDVLDRCPDGGAFDFVDAVAKEVPIRVLARIMGLPEADLDLFIDLGDRLIANTDPDITDVVWGRDDTDAYRRYPFRSPYGKQLWDLGRQVVQDRLADPGDDLLSRLLRAEVDGDRLSETDLDNFFSILVVAGQRDHQDRHRPGGAGLLPVPGAVGPAAGRPWAAGDRDRRGAAVELPDALHAADRHGGHRARRGADPGRRQGGAVVRLGQPGRGGVRPTRTRSTSGAARTGTSASAAAARTCAWACTWPGWRSRWCWPRWPGGYSRFELAGEPRRIRSNFTNGLKALPVRVYR